METWLECIMDDTLKMHIFLCVLIGSCGGIHLSYVKMNKSFFPETTNLIEHNLYIIDQWIINRWSSSKKIYRAFFSLHYFQQRQLSI
jgi:hypothetical protein